MDDHALKINPNEFNAFINKGNRFKFILGDALDNLGKFYESIVIKDNSIKINPKKNSNAYLNKGRIFISILGNTLAYLEKLTKAKEMYESSVMINPTNSKAYYNYGKVIN